MQGFRIRSLGGARGFACTALLASLAGVAAPLQVSPAQHKASSPDLAVDARGNIAMLWVDRSPQDAAGPGQDRHVARTDVYVAVSRDGGGSFGAPVRVNAVAGGVWGQPISRPRIVAAPGGSWHVAYAANDSNPAGSKPALSAHHARSIDGGRSFESPRRLSSPTERDLSAVIHGGFASAEAFGTLAVTPDGRIHVYWIDTRDMPADGDSAAVYGTSSSDDGATFAAATPIAATATCPCCQLMAVASGRSDVLLGARQVTGDGFRPPTVTRLERGGRAAERVPIGAAPWQIAGCPMKPTAVAASGDRVFAAVHDGGAARPGVLLSVSTDRGASFRALGAVHPEAAVSDAPALATNGRSVALVWHAKLQGPRRVFYRIYDMEGRPRTDIRELEAEPGSAQSPVVLARPDGRFQVAWQQGERVFTAALPDR